MNESNKKQTSLDDEREADATSKETLEDIEDNEKPSSIKKNGGEESRVPSPDGAFDERGESDESGESKDAGPM